MCIAKTHVAYMDDRPGNGMYHNVEFPGDRDEGSPLVIQENGRSTVIGMFLKQMKGPALYAQITPDTVNWIRENADWTQESSCALNTETDHYWAKENLFTSCGCGYPNKPARRHKRSPSNRRRRKFDQTRHKNSSLSHYYNRILHGKDVQNNQYPWQVLVFNKLSHYNPPLGSNPDGTNFDLCSGSLISNKHILTSAECVLNNKNDNRKIFNQAENIVVKVGDTHRTQGAFIQIKHVKPHEKAFTDGYNYNIGKERQKTPSYPSHIDFL